MPYTVEATFAGETSVCVPAYETIAEAVDRALEEVAFGYSAIVIGNDGTRLTVVGETHHECAGTTGLPMPGGI